MFKWFKRKQPTIVFEEMLPGLRELCPPIPSIKMERPWMKRMRDDYINSSKTKPIQTTPVGHVARCPGIHKIVGSGFIMRTWQDITINTYNDGKSCDWNYSSDTLSLSEGAYGIKNNWALEKELTLHQSKSFSDYFDDWPRESCKFIFKYSPPWLIHLPKGYNGLIMPIHYNNDERFDVLPGIIEHSLGPISPLNVFLRWNVKEGKTFIPAGTPLYQLHIYKHEKIDYEIINHITEIPHPYFSVRMSRFCKFKINYDKIRKMYG
jgi:hypothetical protein